MHDMILKWPWLGWGIQGVEVTQAIQHYESARHLTDPADRQPDNAVTLIAGKPAWVRVYVRSSWFSGGFTSETHDGGATWADANHVGRFLSRFRFIREPELVGYASGDIVYKYAKPVEPVPRSVQPARAAPSPTCLPIRIPVDLAGDAGTRVDTWDRFGEHVASPRPEPAGDEIVWSGETASGAQAPPGIYIMRVASDGDAESRTLYL